MNAKILNRADKLPDDGWYNIEANGEHINHAAECVLVIDEKARSSITNRFSQEATAAGPNFAGMVVDKDHLGKELKNPSEAMGWNMLVRNRADLLEAKIDWTALGQPLVEAKPGQPPAYKFFSTEYTPADCEKLGTRIVNGRKYAVLRPLRLDGLSLTNDPNNKGQRPISNRNPAATADREENNTTMKNLLKKLGLAEDASEESAVAALDKIQNRASAAETDRDALKKQNEGLLKDLVEQDLAKFAGVITNREVVEKQLIANRTATLEMLSALKLGTTVAAGKDDKPITNRSAAKTPATAAAAATDAESDKERARGAKISNRATELRKANPRLTRAQAFQKAEAELAE